MLRNPDWDEDDFNIEIKVLSLESGISEAVLKSWWEDKIPEKAEICRICKKRRVRKVSTKIGYVVNGYQAGMCETCMLASTIARKQISTYGNGSMVVCPRCNHIYFFSQGGDDGNKTKRAVKNKETG